MESRKLGELTVSALGLGTWTWGHETDRKSAGQQLWRFLDAGGSYVDTAAAYTGGNAERILGELLPELPRDSLVIGTKAGLVSGQVDTTPSAMLAQLDESLRRLKTDHVDLWQLHAWSERTPITETVEALGLARDSGKAKAVGICNVTLGQFESVVVAAAEQRIPLSAIQLQYSLLFRKAEDLLPSALAAGAGLLAWSPLAGGVLTGKYHREAPSRGRASDPRYHEFIQPYLDGELVPAGIRVVEMVAEALGRSCIDVALAWVRDRHGVAAALIGARNDDQLRELLNSVDLTLPSEIEAMLAESVVPLT